jgi:hypothetical protein
LIEFVHDFMLVYDRILDFTEPLPQHVRCQIGLRHALSGVPRPLILNPGPIDGFDYETDWDSHEAPGDEFAHSEQIEIAAASPHFDRGKAAYLLVARLYNWFGFNDDDVPYTDQARTCIEIEQIANRG